MFLLLIKLIASLHCVLLSIKLIVSLHCVLAVNQADCFTSLCSYCQSILLFHFSVFLLSLALGVAGWFVLCNSGIACSYPFSFCDRQNISGHYSHFAEN